MNISMIVREQRHFFMRGRTKSVSYRIRQLLKLKQWIMEHESLIFEALKKDLNKNPFESYAFEIGMVMKEINFALKNLRRWCRKRPVMTPIAQFPSKSFVCPEPYGVVLILSPWNYPFLLSISPLVSAIAAGNCVILKPSEHSPAASGVMVQMIHDIFQNCYVDVIEGDAQICDRLLCEHFDYIFFTGSSINGRKVMEKASKYLTPVTLELGGKSPCIVDSSANIPLAAKRIVWGKFTNAGQTCVAPDYILVHYKVKEALLHHIKRFIHELYGEHPCQSPDYPKIINERHYQRLVRLTKQGNLIIGGECDRSRLMIEPTVIDGVDWDDDVMQEEIFGPILPVLEYCSTFDVVRLLSKKAKPLALYYFCRDQRKENYILRNLSFGGGCINDTLVHLATPYMPFGGVGSSGMGSCHGKAGFDTFSHKKSILKKSNGIDLPFRYPPYRYSVQLLKKLM